MPECQVYRCIKQREGASNGKKIFQITNATKFPANREPPIKWQKTNPLPKFIKKYNTSDEAMLNVRNEI